MAPNPLVAERALPSLGDKLPTLDDIELNALPTVTDVDFADVAMALKPLCA
jgi:hypothetical protein